MPQKSQATSDFPCVDTLDVHALNELQKSILFAESVGSAITQKLAVQFSIEERRRTAPTKRSSLASERLIVGDLDEPFVF
jgi:hypothetical protein